MEFLLLRRSLDRRIGETRLPGEYVIRLWGPALVAAAAGWGMLFVLGGRLGPIPTAALVLAPFGAVYFGGTILLGVPLARELTARYRRKA